MRVLLVDARNMCYKFAWVGRDLRAGTGKSTGAIHGILMGLTALKRKYPDAKFVMVWDGMDVENWRTRLFPGYKANRKVAPSPDLVKIRASVASQIGVIKQLLAAAGVAQIEIPQLEADDVVGILCEKCQSRSWPVIVYSSDQDYLQLMACGVALITSASSAPVSERDIQKKWRCGSADILKLRALLGDVSDGIGRAVSGVGPVAAAHYIDAGIDPSLRSFDAHPRSVREGAERLRAPWPQVHRNWRLMRILTGCHDADFPKDLVGMVSVETRRVLKELAEPPKRNSKVYQEMLETMAALDLEQALAARHDIWQLQMV